MLAAVFVLFVANAVSANPSRVRLDYTPLLNELMPCVAENVKDTDHYICTDDHKMVCLNGWTNLDNMCRDPICLFETSDGKGSSKTCAQGECVRPNTCACEVGWEGVACDRCVKMPGCQNGFCRDEAFECVCNDGWEGALCDIRKCKY